VRIRSIKPEYWRSEDISQLTVEDRLLFIGMWSYVDDNGVGIDRLATVAADLFAGDIERDASETFARVSRGLQNLSGAGLIARYEVDGKRFLHVTNWASHQRIDKPNKARYPLPTSNNAVFPEVSRECRETHAPGAGEQRNRGTEEQRNSKKENTTTATRSAYSEEFESWWSLYYRETKPAAGSKKKASVEYKKATRQMSHDELMAALSYYFTSKRKERASGTFSSQPPHAERWLRDERWTDYGAPATTARTTGSQIPDWSKTECDQILGGEDHWVPGSPPAGFNLMEEREWKQARAAEHLDERRRKAWEVVNSDNG